MFAKVFNSFAGTVTPAPRLAPPGAPFVLLARIEAFVNASTSPVGLEPVAPTCRMSEANGASAYAAATVVTSLIQIKVVGVSVEHGPRAATMVSALFVPAPGLPPVAVM